MLLVRFSTAALLSLTASIAAAQQVPAPVDGYLPAPTDVAAPPPTPAPDAGATPGASVAIPAPAVFPPSVERQLPARPDVLPTPAHKTRIWHLVASGAYTLFTEDETSPHGIFTAGFSLAGMKSFAGRSGALHLGGALRGYLLTSHDVPAGVFEDCGDRSLAGYGALGEIVFAARFIESTLGMGALYLTGSQPSCPSGARLSAHFWSLAISLAVAIAVDPGNTVMLRAELLGYMGDEDVRSVSLGVQVRL